MTDNSKNTQHAHSSNSSVETDTSMDNNRRSFITKFATVAPIAMVSLSKPAWGDLTGTAFRCGISGMISGNVASGPDREECTGGFSPGKWKQQLYCEWTDLHPMTFNDFISMLGGSTSGTNGFFCDKDYFNARLGEILAPNNPDSSGCNVLGQHFDPPGNGNGYFSGSFGWHLIATYLNVTSPLVPNYLFSLDDLQFIVSRLPGPFEFEMGSNIFYDCNDIQMLFNSTYSS